MIPFDFGLRPLAAAARDTLVTTRSITVFYVLYYYYQIKIIIPFDSTPLQRLPATHSLPLFPLPFEH